MSGVKLYDDRNCGENDRVLESGCLGKKYHHFGLHDRHYPDRSVKTRRLRDELTNDKVIVPSINASLGILNWKVLLALGALVVVGSECWRAWLGHEINVVDGSSMKRMRCVGAMSELSRGNAPNERCVA